MRPSWHITHCYDYEPLEQATDETRKQSDIPFGLEKGVQKGISAFRQAMKKNAQLVTENQEEEAANEPQ